MHIFKEIELVEEEASAFDYMPNYYLALGEARACVSDGPYGVSCEILPKHIKKILGQKKGISPAQGKQFLEENPEMFKKVRWSKTFLKKVLTKKQFDQWVGDLYFRGCKKNIWNF